MVISHESSKIAVKKNGNVTAIVQTHQYITLLLFYNSYTKKKKYYPLIPDVSKHIQCLPYFLNKYNTVVVLKQVPWLKVESFCINMFSLTYP